MALDYLNKIIIYKYSYKFKAKCYKREVELFIRLQIKKLKLIKLNS